MFLRIKQPCMHSELESAQYAYIILDIELLLHGSLDDCTEPFFFYVIPSIHVESEINFLVGSKSTTIDIIISVLSLEYLVLISSKSWENHICITRESLWHRLNNTRRLVVNRSFLECFTVILQEFPL